MTRPIGTYRPGVGSTYRPRPTADRAERKAIYNSARWRQLRILFLAEHPLCQDCEARGMTTPAAEVHHLHSVRKRPDLALDPDNLRALCKPCHSLRTARGE